MDPAKVDPRLRGDDDIRHGSRTSVIPASNPSFQPSHSVIPAKVGRSNVDTAKLDPRLRGDDEIRNGSRTSVIPAKAGILLDGNREFRRSPE